MNPTVTFMEKENEWKMLPVKEGVVYKTACEHKHECLEAIRHILDEEATDEEVAHFQENMDKCLPCIENYNLELTIRQILYDKIHHISVPVGLADSIRHQIQNI
jgi:anti-sigma factor (TIGR02949 family)